MKWTIRIPFVSRGEPVPEVQPQVLAPGFEEQMLAAINAERAKAGLGPYWWSEAAAHAAQRRVADMVARGYFAHLTPDGKSGYVEELRAEGVASYAWAGENLSLNNYSVDEMIPRAMATLMSSPTHRGNILEPTAFDSVGVACADRPDGVHVMAQIFLGGAR